MNRAKFDDFALNFAERDGKFRANLRALRRILLSLKKRVNFITGQICPASSSRALPASTRHVLVAAAYALLFVAAATIDAKFRPANGVLFCFALHFALKA